MRMRANIEALTGRVVHRAEMVEENEGADHLLGVKGQYPSDHKAVAKVLLPGLDNLVDKSSHNVVPWQVLHSVAGIEYGT